MPQQLLYATDFGSLFEEASRKGMPKGVQSSVFVDARLAHGLADGTLDGATIQVMASANAASRIDRWPGRGEHVLPAPFEWCAGVLARQRVGQFHAAVAISHGLFVAAAHVRKVLLQRLEDRFGQDGRAVLLPLGVSDHYLEAIVIQVLDAKTQGFDSPQTTSVEKLTEQSIHSPQPMQNRHRLGVREDGRNPFRPLGAHNVVKPTEVTLKHLSVQKQQRRKRLILRGG